MTQKDRQTIGITDTGDVMRVTDVTTGKPIYVAKLPAGTALPRGRPTEKDWLAAMRWLGVKVNACA